MQFDPSSATLVEEPEKKRFDPASAVPFEPTTLVDTEPPKQTVREFAGLPAATPEPVPTGPPQATGVTDFLGRPEGSEEPPSLTEFFFGAHIPVPRLEHAPEDSTAAKIGKSAVNVAGEFVSGATPAFVAAAIPALAAAAPELITGQVKRVQESLETPAMSPERLEAGGSTLLQLLTLGIGAKHALKPKPTLTERFFPEDKPVEAAATEPVATPLTDAALKPEEVKPVAQEKISEEIQGRQENVTPVAEPAVAPETPAAEPKLLPGETQGDLITSTQAEPLKLVGEKGIDFEARAAETDAKALAAEEAKAKAEHEQGLLEDFQEHQARGGDELLDAVAEGGGLPALSSKRADILSGELKNIREEFATESGKVRGGFDYNKVFKADAPDIDALTQHLRSKGFDVETPNDTLSLIQDRIRSGKPLYGSEARGAALEEASFGQPVPIGIAPPGTGKLITAVNRGVSAAKNVYNAVKNVPPFTDFRKSLLDWSARGQRSGQEILEHAKTLRTEIPDKVAREGITNWIQAAGDTAELTRRAQATTNIDLKRGYEAAARLTPEQVAVAQKVKQTYDDLLARGQSYGILTNGLTDYVNQIWKRPPLYELFTSSGRKLSENFRFAKQRVHDSFFDGEQAGLKPATKDIADLLPIYLNEMNNAINSKLFVLEMHKGVASDGRPLLVPRGSGSVVENAATGDKTVLVLPEIPAKATKDYQIVEGNHPALHDWKWATKDTDGNPVIVKVDLVAHPEIAGHMGNVLGQSALRKWWTSSGTPTAEVPKAAARWLFDDAQPVAKQTMLGFFSPFHQVQEGTHAIFHRVNPFTNLPKIDLIRDPAQMDAARHGLMLQPDRLSADKFMEGLGGGQRNLATRLAGKIPGIGPTIERLANGYQEFLFHQYIPALKFKTYEHILTRNMERYGPELSSNAMTPEQVKYLSAQQSNAAYGHLNYAEMARNPTIQHVMQMTLLAPDFLEARARFTGQAFRGKAGREQATALAFGAGIFYLTARVMNKVLDDDYHWDHPFEVIHNNRRYSMRSVPEDIFNMLKDTRTFIYGRLSPLLGRGVVQGLSGVNYRGEKVDWADTFQDLLSSYVPITLQPFARFAPSSKHQPVTPMEQMAGAFGVRISRFSPVTQTYKLASEWEQENEGKIPGVKTERGSYPVSQYQQLRYALEDNDSERTEAELTELAKTIPREEIGKRFKQALFHPFTGSKENDELFRSSLNDKEKQIYDAGVKRREDLWERFKSIYGNVEPAPSTRTTKRKRANFEGVTP